MIQVQIRLLHQSRLKSAPFFLQISLLCLLLALLLLREQGPETKRTAGFVFFLYVPTPVSFLFTFFCSPSGIETWIPRTRGGRSIDLTTTTAQIFVSSSLITIDRSIWVPFYLLKDEIFYKNVHICFIWMAPGLLLQRSLTSHSPN